MSDSKDSVERAAFIKAMRCAASGVTVVTTDGKLGRAGLTISAMCSLSADPPAVLVCINRCSHVLGVIHGNGRFCVNLLGQEQRDVAEVFAGRVEALRHDRFACSDWETGPTGSPMLMRALAALDCELSSHSTHGSHDILIGRVKAIRVQQQEPLIYLDRAYHEIGPRVSQEESVR